MTIEKIVLGEGWGLKGCDVTYTQYEKKDNRSALNTYIARKKHPVHLTLERMFKDLRFHLLDAAGYITSDQSKAETDYLIERTTFKSIAWGDGKVKMTGILEVLTGAEVAPLSPPHITADNYDNFASVDALVETIIEETKLYLSGDMKVSDDELVHRWIAAGKEKDFDPDTFDKLPVEEQKRIAAGIIEKHGGVVFMEDEISEAPEGAEEIESGFLKAEASNLSAFAEKEETPVHNENFAGFIDVAPPADEITMDGEEIILPAK